MIKLDKVSKKFGTGTFGLSNVTLDVDKGEFVFLVGPTGSGKTTIFRLITRETLPTEGGIIVDGWDVLKLPKDKIPTLRKKIGVIFQDLKLLADRTILENIMLPLEVSGAKTEEAIKKVEDVLTQVGLISHKDKFPIQLSGGELQRAAVARALILSPEIILADEATGNLDMATSWEIINLLLDINKKGTTIVMSTHNPDFVKNLSKRVVKMDKGKVIADTKHHDKHKKEEPEKIGESHVKHPETKIEPEAKLEIEDSFANLDKPKKEEKKEEKK
jgi:cell division transport system ATP-binding protein